MKKILLSIAVILLSCILLLTIRCPLYTITGIPCFSCGMTRAYTALLHGHFAEAFAMHPLWWTIPLTALIVLCRNTKIGRLFFKKWFFIGIVILFAVTYALRMYLFFPHTEPMNFNNTCWLMKIYAHL